MNCDTYAAGKWSKRAFSTGTGTGKAGGHEDVSWNKAIEINNMQSRKEIIMKHILIPLVGLFLLLGAAPAKASDVDLGISISDGRLRDLYLAIGDYYRVPPREVVVIRDHYRCPDEELPVVFFLAERAHVEPAVILRLRAGKKSWFEVAAYYHLSPSIFFIPVTMERIGPPYGNAYGYYRKFGPKGDWKKAKLSDREIVDLVNLRFMSEHYSMAPERVMEMRSHEKRFVVINDEIRKEKAKGKPEKQVENGRGHGKGKDKR